MKKNLLLQPVTKELSHPYSDKEKIRQTVLAYRLEEILAEKLRSLIQRNRPRDIYDTWYLFKQYDNLNFTEVEKTLLVKSRNKGIEIESINQFVNNKKHEINRRAWYSSLNHQIPAVKLPDFDNVYDDLEGFIINLMNY